MNQKYYIISEEELKNLMELNYLVGINDAMHAPLDELQKATKLAISRPVPEWATLFVDNFPDAGHVEEIKRS